MNMTRRPASLRWYYLILGVVALLFAGVIYAWSILKAPLGEEFGWTGSQLALNFTLTMCFFCLGGFVGGLVSKRIGSRLSLILAAVLGGLGFFLASRLTAGSLAMLYISYGVMAGLGIGIAYNVIISTVSAWFPDKKGLCSGVLMMGFGSSALVVGKLATALMEGPGWRTAFLVIGLCLAAFLVIAGLVLRKPGEGDRLPAAEKKAAAGGEDFVTEDYPTAKMVRRLSFWQAFLCIVCMSAVGNTVISFARDLCLSVGAGAALATTLVGVLSVCNGLGRIVVGALFDRLGRKKTMLFANLLTIVAAGITLIAVLTHSLPVCILGLCLTGFSYGAGPTITSAFTSAFYGTKYFPVNFSVMNFNLMFASFMATAASGLLESTGGYVGPFAFLLGLAVVSLLLNLSIKRP
ncbi:MAG: OFA family MFS transporter [Oscillospiraceae bacterium]|nr:OFA family MFS transporter [Oscillospiraceae bacterium]